MIKLQHSLPNTITVEGREFFVKTDFRYWLEYDEIITSKKSYSLGEIAFLFEGEVPKCDFSEEVFEFYKNPNSTPRNIKGSSGENVIDFQQDGEYIYASFMSAYGIDLLNTNMHWHKFKALVLGLPSNTIMSEIMAKRGWKKDNRKLDKVYAEQKKAWALPRKQVEEDKELIKGINELFYNA